MSLALSALPNESAPIWRTRRFAIDLQRVQVMGIVNVTPDSFSDGGQHGTARSAIAHCERLLADGVDILDIGGESSRPGAQLLSEDDEWSRVAPVLAEALKLGVPVSIDTYKPALMARALDLGVDIINDIQALRMPGALEAVSTHADAGVCLMHMRGDSSTMQALVDYGDVVAEVAAFLVDRARALREAGVAAERIVLDPGYGFAKTTAQNFELLARLQELQGLGYPLLIGWSRKRAIGDVTGRPVDQRLAGSLAAALAAVARGARIVRVHDVAATVDALKVWHAAAGGA